MGNRVGLIFWLAAAALATLLVLGSSASAHYIKWEATGGYGGARQGCNSIVYPGQVATTETSMTQEAARQAFIAIYQHSPPAYAGSCYIDTDDCDTITSNWEAIVCTNGVWRCMAGYGEDECNVLERIGTWSVITVCGDGQKEEGVEQCDPPGANSAQCGQTTTASCVDGKPGTRDAYGTCSSTCQCVQDAFTYGSCVKDQCGAQCDASNPCSPSECSQIYTDYCSSLKLVEYNANKVRDYTPITNSMANTCGSACLCSSNTVSCPAPPINMYCVKDVCNATCDTSHPCLPSYCSGNTLYSGGSCTSECSCTYSTTDCVSLTDQCNIGSCHTSGCVKTPKAVGTPCTTTLGQTGTCSSAGQCAATPMLSQSIGVGPNPIRVTLDTATLYADLSCSNMDCGMVYVYPRNGTGLPYEDAPLNNISGLSVSCTTANCEYPCGNMVSGSKCSPRWLIKGKSTGTYPMFFKIISNITSLSRQTDTLYLYVNEVAAGTLSATLMAEPATVTAGSSTKVTATISCSGTMLQDYCGNVTSWLLYIGSGGLSTASANPSTSCKDLWAGGACTAVWHVNATIPGTYTLSVVAASDYHTAMHNVANATYQTQLAVNERPVGVLSFQSAYVTPAGQSIVLGGIAGLGAGVKCSSSASGSVPVSCGPVKVYPMYNGIKITQSGSLSVITTERDCGTMSSSSPVCAVYWNVTGRALGSYSLAMNASSSLAETSSATSQPLPLEVTRNFGSLSVPWTEMSPGSMNLTTPAGTARLSAMINCSTPDCGKASVSLWLDAQMVGPGTPVSASQNMQECSAFPCQLNWTVAGNLAGTYYVMVKAESNETGKVPGASNSSSSLVVTDPRRPQLSVSTDLKDIEVRPGQQVQIRAAVTCLMRDCGQVTISLEHDSGGWMSLPYGSMYLAALDQNPVYTSLGVGQKSEPSWSVNFTQKGAFKLRIAAVGSAANITNDEKSAVVNVSEAARAVTILSPPANQRFLRGDAVLLKMSVLSEGGPVTGLVPTVEGADATLYDDGAHDDDRKDDGTYAGRGRIPAATGQHCLRFRAGSMENTTCIYVIPELFVTVAADNESYFWGEVITISGEVRREDRGDTVPSNVTIGLAHDKEGSWKYEIVLALKDGRFSFSYPNTDTPNLAGSLSITASARDDYGNGGQGSAGASIKVAEGVRGIAFLMKKYNYRRGENMSIAVKPLGEGGAGGVVEVRCTLAGGAARALVERSGEYQGSYPIPASTPLGNRTLSCSFTGKESGTGYRSITIEPMSLNISMVSPFDLTYGFVPVTSTEPVDLKAAVFYPDNTPVMDAMVEITTEKGKINMTRTAVPGIYTASGVMFSKERAGAAMTSISLAARDLDGNYGRNEVDVVVDSGQSDWWWPALIVAGLAALLLAIYLYIRSKQEKEPPRIQIQEKIIRIPVRERVREIVYRPVAMPQRRADPTERMRQELSRLEEKHRTVTNAKDLAEQQYYKRQIDEATFNKLMQSYEEKLIEADAAIRQKRKELSEMEGG